MKVSIRNQQKLIKVNTRKITRILRNMLILLGLPAAEISLLFVNDRQMRLLNRQYRGIDRSTDVLSFPQYRAEELTSRSRKRLPVRSPCLQTPSGPLLLGDLVINLHKAQRQALDNRLSPDEELKRLLIHGLLHLVGYNHEQDRNAARRMQKLSRELSGKLR